MVKTCPGATVPPSPLTTVMKTFLQHDENGLFYKDHGWVKDVSDALAFETHADAEAFRTEQRLSESHAVVLLDPALIARFLARPPGRYQAGE